MKEQSGDSIENRLKKLIETADMIPEKVLKPWGGYITVWKDKMFRVKIIFVLPRRRLSLQRHKHRKEKWFIVEGSAFVTKGNSCFTMGEGNSLTIEKDEVHRVENRSDDKILKIVEIWMGDLLDEDDIERLADDYGRV